MAGALRKTMVYLGLAEEDERFDSYDDEEPQVGENRDERRPERDERRSQVTPITRGAQVPRVVPQPMTDLCRITTIHPRTYNEAKKIGESFRDGVPVIMNLGDMDDSDAKRLVDFSAGLVFGLHGAIERVTAKVFLLSPAHVEVSAAEQPAVHPPGFFNQS
jgi:cell division inhibitor SepF